MFRNKILLMHSGKFFKYKFKTHSAVLVSLSGMTFFRFKTKKMFSYLTPVQNSFRPATLFNPILPGVICNNKQMSKTADTNCWKCKQILKVKNFTCASCGALQYPKPTINFFELLGISQMYDINLEELSQKFRDLQMIFHPDKFANKTKEELEISEIYSRLINKAYTTLKDPVARGLYLLEFQKYSGEPLFPLDQEFLMSIMEENEILENADNQKTLVNLSKTNNENIEKGLAAIKNAFRSNRLHDAKVNLTKLNYYLKLSEKIKEKQNDFSLTKEK